MKASETKAGRRAESSPPPSAVSHPKGAGPLRGVAAAGPGRAGSREASAPDGKEEVGDSQPCRGLRGLVEEVPTSQRRDSLSVNTDYYTCSQWKHSKSIQIAELALVGGDAGRQWEMQQTLVVTLKTSE